MPVLEREEYIEQAYFFHTLRERLVDGLPSQDILSRIGEELLSTTRLPLAVSFLHRDQGAGPDGPGHGPDQPLFHAVPDPRRRPGRARHQPVRDGAGPPGPGTRGEVQGREALAPGLVRLPVRGPGAQPAGLHPGPGRHGGRPLLHGGLARLHPDAPHPARRRRFRRPDLRAIRAIRHGTPAAQPRVHPQVPDPLRREGGKDRAGQPRARSDVPLLGTCSASSAIPKSPGPGGPTSSRPASCSSNRRSPSSKTASRSPRATCSTMSTSPRSWSSPRIPPASRKAGVGSSHWSVVSDKAESIES